MNCGNLLSLIDFRIDAGDTDLREHRVRHVGLKDIHPCLIFRACMSLC